MIDDGTNDFLPSSCDLRYLTCTVDPKLTPYGLIIESRQEPFNTPVGTAGYIVTERDYPRIVEFFKKYL